MLREFKERHLLSKLLVFIILALVLCIINNLELKQQLSFVINLLTVVLIIDLFIVNRSDKQKQNRTQKRKAFASYILAIYKTLNINNTSFEEKLPNYLNILINWDNNTVHFRDEKTEEHFLIFVNFAERNELPLFSIGNQNNYQRSASLFLLSVLIGSYYFCDSAEPMAEYNKELYFKLLDLCWLQQYKESANTFCSKDTRDKLNDSIRDIMKDLPFYF